MSIYTVVPGDTVRDQLSIYDDTGVTKISGLTVVGGDFIITVYQDGAVTALPVVISEVGALGEYLVEFTPNTNATWIVEIFVVPTQEAFKITAVAGGAADLTTILAQNNRILGLLHNNALLDNQTYDSEGQLLTARLRIFDNASNVPNAPGGSETTGLLFEYEIEATYAGANQATKYTMRQVL